MECASTGPLDQWRGYLRCAGDEGGMGSAKPCWQCVEWCRWAGVKRIFHWNGEDGKFDMVKVNTAERDQYETHVDIRLYDGMVSGLV